MKTCNMLEAQANIQQLRRRITTCITRYRGPQLVSLQHVSISGYLLGAVIELPSNAQHWSTAESLAGAAAVWRGSPAGEVSIILTETLLKSCGLSERDHKFGSLCGSRYDAGCKSQSSDRGLKNECCSPDSQTERSQSIEAYRKPVGKAKITFCGLRTKFARFKLVRMT